MTCTTPLVALKSLLVTRAPSTLTEVPVIFNFKKSWHLGRRGKCLLGKKLFIVMFDVIRVVAIVLITPLMLHPITKKRHYRFTLSMVVSDVVVYFICAISYVIVVCVLSPSVISTSFVFCCLSACDFESTILIKGVQILQILKKKNVR